MSRFKGAGAILYSPLVYQGWRFPFVQLTENDDHYLFEIEVTYNAITDWYIHKHWNNI